MDVMGAAQHARSSLLLWRRAVRPSFLSKLSIDFAARTRQRPNMELNQLTAEERVALVALLEFVIESNGRVSEDEADRIDAVVGVIGEDAYRQAATEVDRRFAGEEELRAFLPSITRQEARELIYETALEAATSDAIDAHESQLLEWLAGVWQISTRIDEPDS